MFLAEAAGMMARARAAREKFIVLLVGCYNINNGDGRW
jgi:hypothetical protein